MSHSQVHGLLVIDKPTGMTSREAVNRVQRTLPRRTKIGHAGTLDPLASGVLVVCVGVATRLVEYVQQMEKEYETEITLGATSTTDDADGEITPGTCDTPPPPHQIEDALKRFHGTIQQIPPAYSANKINGKRSYKLARAGIAVELQPRPVQIHEIQLMTYEYPRLLLKIRCGKGTYIRSIARDLGNELGCGGYVKTLRRTRNGVFQVNDGISLQNNHTLASVRLQSLERAVASLAALKVDVRQKNRLANGLPISVDRPHWQFDLSKEQAAVFFEGRLFAVGRIDRDMKVLLPEKVLVY